MSKGVAKNPKKDRRRGPRTVKGGGAPMRNGKRISNKAAFTRKDRRK